MKTDKLDEIRTLRNAANSVDRFWDTWRTQYLSDSRCDKKAASFVSPDARFAAFSFKLIFDAHAGYYGNSSCSRIFSLDDGLAQKYFSRVIQEMARPIFQRAAELMLADAADLTAEAEKEVAALQAMLDDVRASAPSDSDGPRMAETNEDLARGEAGPARAEATAKASPEPSGPQGSET